MFLYKFSSILFLLFFFNLTFGFNQTRFDTLWYSSEKLIPKAIIEVSSDLQQPNGLWKEFYPDGSLKITCTKIGEEYTGRYLTYHKNGKLHKEFSYENFVLNGPYTVYYSNSKKQLSANYSAGKLDG
ncbi:MAG: toxin-antitoxin system YwqK family antitoxin, partial [Chitinophagales bacterium]